MLQLPAHYNNSEQHRLMLTVLGTTSKYVVIAVDPPKIVAIAEKLLT